MSTLERNFPSIAMHDAGIAYAYNDPDDLKSIRRWLARKLSPSAGPETDPDVDAGEPFLFIEPIDGTFKRPAVTIRLLATIPRVTQGHASSNYKVEHSLIFTAYGRDRTETIAIAQRLMHAFTEGGDPSQARFRIPMWAFDLQVRLARMMRVLPESLSMGLDETNEQGEWARPLEGRIEAPRIRVVPGVPGVRSIGSVLTVN